MIKWQKNLLGEERCKFDSWLREFKLTLFQLSPGLTLSCYSGVCTLDFSHTLCPFHNNIYILLYIIKIYSEIRKKVKKDSRRTYFCRWSEQTLQQLKTIKKMQHHLLGMCCVLIITIASSSRVLFLLWAQTSILSRQVSELDFPL